MKLASLLLFILPCLLMADVKSTSGTTKFDSDSDSSPEMTLNTTGLGIGVTPSANLHVSGNAVIPNQVFVGSSIGSSNLNINGTIAFGIQTVNSDITLSGNSVILADTSSDNIFITLPAANTMSGRQYLIKKQNNQNNLWVMADEEIDGQYNLQLVDSSSSQAYVRLYSNGQAWYILSESSSNAFGTPTDSLVLWLDADDIDGDHIPEALSEGNVISGNLVNYWRDKSSTSSHLSQDTTSSQPILRPANQNGKASVYFDGTDDFMKNTGFNQTSAQHIFMAFTLFSHAANDTFVSSDNDRGNIRMSGGATLRAPGNGSDANDFTNPDGVSRIDGASGFAVTTGSINVYSATRGSTLNATVYDNLAIGRARDTLGRYPEFELHELLIYTRVLTDSERDAVETYLKDKWGAP